jgi:alpha-L-fucosidase
LIPDASVERLQSIGDWMRGNSEAIYATVASPFNRQLPWGRCTRKTKGHVTTLYFHVFSWPANGQLTVPGLKTAPGKCRLLASKLSLRAALTDDGLNIAVPQTPPDPISTTIVAQFNQPPVIAPLFITPQADGSIALDARDAELHGEQIQLETRDGQDNIGYWTNPDDWADWQFKLTSAGKFTISAVISARDSGSFDLSVGGQALHCAAPKTADYSDYKSVDLGAVEIAAPGLATLAIHPVKNGWHPMDVKSIKLVPANTKP